MTDSLLTELLDQSPYGVIAYEAIRDRTGGPFDGQILDYRIIYCNSQALHLSGLTTEQLTNQLLFQRRPDARQSADQLRRIVEQREPVEQEYFDAPSGRWVALVSRPVGDGFFTTIQDISDSKRATQQNEDQARLFDGVLKSMTDGLSVLEALRDEDDNLIDLQYIRVSRAILNDTGLTEAQMLGSTMLTHFPGVVHTPFWSAYQQVLRTGQAHPFEAHYTDDNIDNYVTGTVSQLDANRLISTYTIINDQKRIEQRALEQSAQLQSVLDSCQIPIVLFEAMRNDAGQIIDFRYVIQNEANARTVGHPVVQTAEKTMLEVLPTLKPTGVFDRYVAVAETGQPQRFEQYLSDGVTEGWFDFSVVRQGDGIVVAATDQTLLRQTLQRAEQLVSELQRSNQNLEQFAYVASHDLQEPLRKIRTFGDLLLNQYSERLPPDARSLLGRMQSGAERMSALIRDLLAYAQLSTVQEPFQPVDLNTILTEIGSDLELVITEKKARLRIGPLPTLMGYPIQLRQLFQNLLANAFKFSRPDTAPDVSVSASSVSLNEVPASVPDRSQKTWTAIRVTDNGIGFDEQQQERIFQLFERLHGRSQYAGTGIGLAVCRKVAENHGGALTARSQPGQGATFTVFLPI